MSSFFTKLEIEKIVSFAQEAGEIASIFFTKKNFETWKKSDGSKVTSADIAVSDFLEEKLTNAFSQIPLISEEGKLPEQKFEGDVFWLIDPIDGTSNFSSGNTAFATSIALVKNKKPIFGLIHAPLFEGGKMIFSNHKNQLIRGGKNGKREILPPSKQDKSKLRITTSKKTSDEEIKIFTQQNFSDFSGEVIVERIYSAVAKFFRLLEGDADIYLNMHPSMEWDSAAGQILLELINGKVRNLSFNQKEFFLGEEISYQKPGYLNQNFVAYFS